MSVQNPDRVVTKQDLKDFYDDILPYLGGGSSVSTLQDVELENLSNGQTLVYDSAEEKWKNGSSGGGGDTSDCYKTSDTAETGIDDADYFPFYDASATAKKKTLWSNIKSVLKTYFDTLYSTVKSRGTPASGGTALSLVNTGDMYTWNNKQDALTAGTNIGISGNTISATNTLSLVYSTSEQVIGKWVDGSYLYQKTINFGSLPNNTIKSVAHGISNMKNVAYLTSIIKNTSNPSFCCLFDMTSNGQSRRLVVDATNVNITTQKDDTTFIAYVTIQYTKSK